MVTTTHHRLRLVSVPVTGAVSLRPIIVRCDLRPALPRTEFAMRRRRRWDRAMPRSSIMLDAHPGIAC